MVTGDTFWAPGESRSRRMLYHRATPPTRAVILFTYVCLFAWGPYWCGGGPAGSGRGALSRGHTWSRRTSHWCLWSNPLYNLPGPNDLGSGLGELEVCRGTEVALEKRQPARQAPYPGPSSQASEVIF